VEHAGAGGDDFLLNTRDFDIQTSVDGQKFSTVASVTENIQSVTTYDIKPTKARYVRLNVITPAQIAGSAANIYELQVFAACGTDNLDCMVAGAPQEQIAQQPHRLPEKESTPEAMSAESTGAPGLAYAAGPQAPAQEPSKEPTEVTGTGLVITAPQDVAAPPADAQVTASGLAMKELKPGTGSDHPLVNDCVAASFVAWKTDGSLFSTSTSMNDSEEICLNDSIMGIREALRQMVAGEKRRLWVPEDLTFRAPHHHVQRRPEDEEPPHKDLTFELELHSIMKAPPTPENLQPPPDALKTPSGLAYQVLKSGTGTTHPSTKSTVMVNVSGWRSNGRLFESTMMAKHPAMVRLAMAPSGWREGVLNMSVGEKARFWIPAALAYGDEPANRFNPAGDLVYEVELLSVQ
jgi:peptidylprolyl isomerase